MFEIQSESERTQLHLKVKEKTLEDLVYYTLRNSVTLYKKGLLPFAFYNYKIDRIKKDMTKIYQTTYAITLSVRLYNTASKEKLKIMFTFIFEINVDHSSEYLFDPDASEDRLLIITMPGLSPLIYDFADFIERADFTYDPLAYVESNKEVKENMINIAMKKLKRYTIPIGDEAFIEADVFYADRKIDLDAASMLGSNNWTLTEKKVNLADYNDDIQAVIKAYAEELNKMFHDLIRNGETKIFAVKYKDKLTMHLIAPVSKKENYLFAT
ncbi:hypothetical protein STSV2_24 [Sulfolobus virus STSV2]|uniref:hypothetical protein n=1 Tax=Sulfolobus virus STSV2 TaxID=1123964 RepID=UPI0002A7EFD8|nr:hypothetical protein STSV2_24 [Sulfolobus virus STSV2]AFU92003.1 hypothetical protein STSV2_24 [Sulfolobus virus STSV2]